MHLLTGLFQTKLDLQTNNVQVMCIWFWSLSTRAANRGQGLRAGQRLLKVSGKRPIRTTLGQSASLEMGHTASPNRDITLTHY